MTLRTISRKSFSTKYYTRASPLLGWTYKSTTNRSVVTRTADWPATVRRTPPLDTFLSGTARTTASAVRGDTGFTYWNSQEMFQDFPVSEAYPLSRVLVPGVTIDRELMYNQVRREARGQAVNLANMLAEYRKTANLFVDIAKVVATRGRSLVKRHPDIGGFRGRGRPSVSRTAAASWLQFQYGVQPLAYDLIEAYDDLKKAASSPLYAEGVVTRKARGRAIGQTISQNTTVSPVNGGGECHRTLLYRTQYRASMNTNYLVSSLAAHGFTNPLGVAYELTPYSFVVDWFINFGEVIQSLDNALIFDKLYVIDSSSDRISRRTFSTAATTLPGEAFEYTRTDVRGAPKPISVVSSFKWAPHVTAKRVASALSLLRQAR